MFSVFNLPSKGLISLIPTPAVQLIMSMWENTREGAGVWI